MSRNELFLHAQIQRRKREMAKQAQKLEETLGLIAQAQAEYQAIVE